MVVACVALVVALGGTSYAALRLPSNSVGTRQLRNGAVTKVKIAPATLKALTGSGGAPGGKGGQGAQGPAGPKGATGATGQPGSAGPGYARYSTIPGSGSPGGYVTLSSSWTDVVSTSVTLQRTSYIQINGEFDAATGSTTLQSMLARLSIDGTAVPGTIAEGTTVANGVNNAHVTLPVADVLTLTAGTHTITLQGSYTLGNITPVAFDRSISAVDEG
jgi:hypothetical protein